MALTRTIPRSENGTSYHYLRAIASGLACARVSSDDRKDDLERQKQVLERYCARRGWTSEVIADPDEVKDTLSDVFVRFQEVRACLATAESPPGDGSLSSTGGF